MSRSTPIQGSLRYLKIFAVTAAFPPLFGCARYVENVPANTMSWNSVPPAHFENEALAIIGIRPVDHAIHYYGIMGISGSNAVIPGDKSWAWWTMCAHTDAKSCLGEDGLIYHIYRMPPGTYAVAWVKGKNSLYASVKARQVQEVTGGSRYGGGGYHVSLNIVDGVVADDTPLFTLNPNDVVYVGTMVFETDQQGQLVSYLEENQHAARGALAKFGETRPMAFRPWTRKSGEGARPWRKLNAIDRMPR